MRTDRFRFLWDPDEVDETNPTARALRSLQLLQDRPGMTADRLGELLGVSGRAARRYVSVLREAGIPVESERGPYGGYRVGRGVRLPPLMFTTAEALGLVMAVLDGHHDPDDAADPVGSALGKIVQALPAPVAAQAEAVRRAIAPAPDRGAARPDPSITNDIVRAFSEDRRVRLRYRTEAGSVWMLDVEPWAVVVRHGRWYVLGHSHTADARRAYRVDRVLEVQILDETFTPPADLDPVAALEEHLAVGWEYEVEVVIEADVETAGRFVPRALGRLEPLDDGTTRLLGSTGNPSWYAERLAAFPAPFRILQCPELREAVAVIGNRFLAAAGDPPGPP